MGVITFSEENSTFLMKIPLKIYLEVLSPSSISRKYPIDFNAPVTHFKPRKMLVEFIVEQDERRSLVGMKDEQNKKALNNKKYKGSIRSTYIKPEKIKCKRKWKKKETKEDQRTTKKRKINRLGSHIFSKKSLHILR